ncbi:hypothetical protein O1611_g2977 [Lasiodiplodia mahajangana]|uniref:Uncharacterized protein n=1 Tax=Lasiodiplodia mahajangana TaxID=1108764 RepID=A0ACC2JTI5_9PEZI|nr:hypothetical protein O1611_g2977 [Lasiodiplodia mahajangana]
MLAANCRIEFLSLTLRVGIIGLRLQNAAHKTRVVDIILDPSHKRDDRVAGSEKHNSLVTSSCGDDFQKPGLVDLEDPTAALYTTSSASALLSPDPMIPLMAEDLVLQQLPAWSHTDSMVRIPMPTLNEDHASRYENGFTINNCTCNETTGPCPGHIEKMRAQVLGEASWSLATHQQHKSHNPPGGEIPTSQAISQSPLAQNSFSRPKYVPLFNSHTLTHAHGAKPVSFNSEQHQQQPFHHHNSTESCSNIRMSVQSPPTMPLFSASSSSMSSRTSLSGEVLPGKVSLLEGSNSATARLAAAHGTSEADMTRRFVAIIDLVQSLGFKHIDEMAMAYYTASFERESLPAMAQSASRSRRLKPMLLELQRSSVQWSRWESRGLREAISEAAGCTYIAEMEAQGRTREPNQYRNESVSLIVAIERLLREHGWGRRDGASQSRDWEGDMLSEQLDAAPDSMPCLWTLLTELAGAQGLYCDRTARAALAILLSAPN